MKHTAFFASLLLVSCSGEYYSKPSNDQELYNIIVNKVIWRRYKKKVKTEHASMHLPSIFYIAFFENGRAAMRSQPLPGFIDVKFFSTQEATWHIKDREIVFLDIRGKHLKFDEGTGGYAKIKEGVWVFDKDIPSLSVPVGINEALNTLKGDETVYRISSFRSFQHDTEFPLRF